MVGGSFVGLGSAKTGADGVFDIRFNAGAGGTFIILDAKTQLRLSKFKWPENKRFHGLLIPQSPPKTSTRTRTTTTTTTSKTKTKTSTTTVPCGPFYDGTTLPFRAWKGPDPSHYRATFLDIDVNPTDGSIYACGYTETEFYFESFNVSANWAKRGFVMKMDRMGVIKWVQALNQETGQQSEIGCGLNKSSIESCWLLTRRCSPPACKLSTDQTSLWISAISSENPIKFGTFIFPLTGNRDGLIATLATSTGSITYATSFGTLSKYLFNSGRVSPSGSNVYLSHNAKLGGLSLPNGKSVACTYGDCCFLAKYSGSTLLWATTFVDVSILAFLMYCYPSAVTSADGSKVFVAGKDTIAIFDSGTGAIIASKQVVNTSEIMDIAILGTDLFIVGTSIEPSIMVDSVKVSKPSPGVQRWGYIIRFATTATGFAASAATYIGTDEFQAHIWSLRPAYSVAGYPKALVMTIELRGSRLKTGTGYVSPTYYGEPCTINFQYSVGVTVWMCTRGADSA